MKRHQSPLASRLFGGSAILLALYTVLFGGAPSLSSSSAERILSELDTHFSSEASRRGKEARLQYSTVDIHGFAYDKWARVMNPSFDFIYQQWQGGKRVGLSTETLDLLPDRTNGTRLHMRLGDVVNIILSSELLATLEPLKPIHYVVNYKAANNGEGSKHRLIIPGDVRINTLDPKRSMTVALTTPVIADITFSEPQHKTSIKATSSGVSIQGDRGRWNIISSDIRFDASQRASDVIESKGTITLDNLGYHNATGNAPAYSLTAAWMMKEQRNISGATDASVLTIEHSLLTDGNVKIAANGAVHFDLDDAPYGEIVVEIANPSEFLKSGWIVKDRQAEAAALLNDMMGTDMATHKQAIITIERAKNGGWMIGKLPLATLLEKDFMGLFIFNERAINEQETTSGDKTS